MVTPPGAPWTLRGECAAALVRPGRPAPLPAGIERLPGPSLLVAARYESSSVGAYLELTEASPARVGARPGLCVTTMAVDSEQSLLGGRSNWGFPKELASLRWAANGDERSLDWEDGGVAITARARGPAVPFLAPVVCLQLRSDGPVLVPGWLRGRLRWGQVAVRAGATAAEPLQALAGRHPGLVVTRLRLLVSAARPAS